MKGLQQTAHRGGTLGAPGFSAARWCTRAPGRREHRAAGAGAKTIWLQTSNKDAFQAGLESGAVSSFVFGPDPAQLALAGAWAGAARFQALLLDERGALRAAGGGGVGAVVGEVVQVDGPEATRALEARVMALAAAAAAGGGHAVRQGGGGGAGAQGGRGGQGEEGAVLVVDARDWKVIPAENLVALAQRAPHAAAAAANGASGGGGGGAAPPPPPLRLRLLAAAGSAGEGRLMLEALQAGTCGVLLRTEDAEEVRSLARYVQRRAAEESGGAGPGGLGYQAALVMAVRPLGMGDRACVDLACLLQPGEGLLVGSFARCLALVHSECDESDYIASRPFRVNAGPVHAYVAAPGGRTRYLSELASGAEVLVADAAGRTRTAMVGRVKIERRPLVLVELETQPDGNRHSLMLQNAETVKLVGPVAGEAVEVEEEEDGEEARPPSGGVARGPPAAAMAAAPDASGAAGAAEAPNPAASSSGARGGGGEGNGGGGGRSWRAVSVSALQPGDLVYVLLQAAARHTGIAIDEFIVEK